MDRYSARIKTAVVVLGVVATIISCLVVVQTKRLHLPLPLALGLINILIPICGLIGMLIPSRASTSRLTPVLSLLGSSSSFIPFVTFVLSLVYSVRSDVLTCTSERRWLELFRHHDTAIRNIQDRLQCCGFNSLRDRAWPFPSHDNDAETCERTLRYTIRCADVWLHQESTTAGLNALASLLNWILMISLLVRTRGGNLLGTSITSISRRYIEDNSDGEQPASEATYRDESRLL